MLRSEQDKTKKVTISGILLLGSALFVPAVYELCISTSN
jgi:hypothetical protein